MELAERRVAGTVVLSISGSLDAATVEPLETRLNAFIDAGESNLVLDCAGLTYLSSAGIRALLTARKRLAGPRGRIALVRPAAAVREVLEISGVAAFFPACETESEALESLGERR